MYLLLLLGKIISRLSKIFKLGSGYTWPGHIILKLNPNFINVFFKKNRRVKIIIVVGTNGKTTTSLLIKHILSKNNVKLIHNDTGANLLSGAASLLISKSDFRGGLNCEAVILEIDENTLPLALDQIEPDILVALNLFRDQLDRYGEINTLYDAWKRSIKNLTKKTKLILNADDPLISGLSNETDASILYFGLCEEKKKSTDYFADSIYCTNCNGELEFKSTTYSHLGNWMCVHCGNKRPKKHLDKLTYYPLEGEYNKYNAIASVLASSAYGINITKATRSLTDFQPAFGRQEILEYKNNKIQLFLSKNPTSFNQSLEIIMNHNPSKILLLLNDRIPDGRDVSWIWDLDFEKYKLNNTKIIVSGDRYLDMAVRIKYALLNQNLNYKDYLIISKDMNSSINNGVSDLEKNKTLYILATYSAMLDLRKIITGRKIL